MLAKILSSGRFQFVRKATKADITKYGIHHKSGGRSSRMSDTGDLELGKTKRKKRVSGVDTGDLIVSLSGIDLAKIRHTGGCILGKVGRVAKRICFNVTKARPKKRKARV
jgi:hypothetical protein